MADNNLKPALSSKDVIASGKTKMSAQLLDPTHIAVSWKTLSGNQPETFGNVVSVWSGAQIDWGNQPEPILTMPITDNASDGDTVLTLGSAPPGGPPYIVAYGTSNSGTAYCAAQVVDSGKTTEPLLTEIDLRWQGMNSLLAGFATLPGNNPKSYGNWIGLWQGPSYSYDSVNRIAQVGVDGSLATGSQAMNRLNLTVDTVYTLTYACGPRNQDLAAWVTFRTPPFLSRLLRMFVRMLSPRG